MRSAAAARAREARTGAGAGAVAPGGAHVANSTHAGSSVSKAPWLAVCACAGTQTHDILGTFSAACALGCVEDEVAARKKQASWWVPAYMLRHRAPAADSLPSTNICSAALSQCTRCGSCAARPQRPDVRFSKIVCRPAGHTIALMRELCSIMRQISHIRQRTRPACAILLRAEPYKCGEQM